MPNLNYPLDSSAKLASNLITSEVHTLANKPLRAIAPRLGAFFVDSLVIREQVSQKRLKLGEDYVVGEYYRSLTLRFRKELAGVILIKNRSITGNIEIDYQCLGEYYTESSPSAEFINNKPKELLEIPNWGNIHTAEIIVPNKSIVEFDSQVGFEYLVYALEKLRSFIISSDMGGFNYALKLITSFKDNLVKLVDSQIDASMKAYIDEFKASLDKSLAGLSHLLNLPVATHDQGMSAGTKDYQYKDSDHRYVASLALVGFKQALYNFFIDSDLTGIDKLKGVSALPRLSVLAGMTNGTRYVFDSIENMTDAKVQFDITAYPDTQNTKQKWVVYKTTNDNAGGSSSLLAFSLESGYIYTGVLSNASTGILDIRWSKVLTQKDARDYIEQIQEHIDNENNPHGTTAFDVGLGDVENLNIVTKEDVICRKPANKYVTHDALLLFWKLYLKDIKKFGDEETDEDKVKVADRIKLIMAPCGPCGQEIKPKNPPVKIAPEPPRPRDQLLAVWCVKNDRVGRFTDGFGKSYERIIERNSNDCKAVKDTVYKERGYLYNTYCDDKNQWGRYSDGRGSFYVALIEENSKECGGSSATTAHVEVKNEQAIVLGLGYSLDYLAKDPDANVVLSDTNGNKLCYIFPTIKLRTIDNKQATVELRNSRGEVVGYLMRK